MGEDVVKRVARAIVGVYDLNRLDGTPSDLDAYPVDIEAAAAAIAAYEAASLSQPMEAERG